MDQVRDSMKILVISLAGIGDTLIATPLIHELRASHPQAVLEAFVLWSGSQDLLEGNPHLNAVHQKNLIQAGPLESFRFIWGLRKRRYDVTINTHPQSRIAYRVIARLIGAPLRLSHLYDNQNILDGFLTNRTIPQDYSVHGIENNLRLISLLGKTPVLSEHEFELFLTDQEKTWAERWLAEHGLSGRHCLGIHVGSGGTKNLPLKRWPLEQYVVLLQRFTRSHPEVAVLLFGGPQEEEAHGRILQAVTGSSVFAPNTKGLRQAAALLQRCYAFLSVDTALMHLAAAMKVPNQIVIEAPTLNATNVPWHNPYRLIRNPAVAGRNLDYYRYDGRPIKGSPAELRRLMESVTVEDVYAVLKESFPTD
jgi:ADP-heptose:LPS heptosyltransferase